ncbi:MAG: hypothetical protein KF747_03470 [Nitrospira sp.]|nr:hypothetical protein [Nitrospira sp.]
MVKYTRQQATAIRRALPPLSDPEFSRLLASITSTIYDATTPEIISLGPKPYKGEAQERLQALIDALDETRETYKRLGGHLESGIDAALPQMPFVRDSYSDERRTTVTCLLSSDQFPLALDTVRQAALQAMKGISGPRTGAPRNEVVRTAIHGLLDLFEVATGVPPKVYSAPYSKDGYAGTAYAYLVACLVPWRLLPRKQLGSALLVAYRDWKSAKGFLPKSK